MIYLETSRGTQPLHITGGGPHQVPHSVRTKWRDDIFLAWLSRITALTFDSCNLIFVEMFCFQEYHTSDRRVVVYG